jgi:8-amino-7-oxononanoate synthase
MFTERYRKRLLRRQESGLLRIPPAIAGREGKYIFIGSNRVLNFASNDYLGLGVSDKLRQKVAGSFQKYGTSSSSSRLVSGNFTVISRAEEEYARHFGYEAALFFSSGYQANIGLLSALFEKGDAVMFDKHIHASSIKGITLSGASFLGYNHNSMNHLRRRLEGNRPKQAAVLAESLFSMDGDFLDVRGLGSLKKEYGFFSIVDEAHAFGAVGEGGRGLARPVADIAVGTFGKALGLFGAFVLLPAVLKEYLFNFSSPLIYSTTLPAAHAASAMDVLEIVAESEEQRTNLSAISGMMKEDLLAGGFQARGDAHIIALEIGDETTAMQVSQRLLARDILVSPVRYPTVPAGKAILRIGMTALHGEEDVKFFSDALKDVRRETGWRHG